MANTRGGFNDPMGTPGTTTGATTSGGMGQTAGSAMESVKEGMSTMADKARDVASNVTERVRDAASTVSQRASDMASSAAQCTQDMAARVGHRAEDMVADLTQLIRRYPVQSVLAGLGVGFLLAQVLRSNDR